MKNKILKTWMGRIEECNFQGGMGDYMGVPERKFRLIDDLDELKYEIQFNEAAEYYILTSVDPKTLIKNK